jgi:hypothetical protein
MVMHDTMNSKKEKIFDQNELGDECVEDLIHQDM